GEVRSVIQGYLNVGLGHDVSSSTGSSPAAVNSLSAWAAHWPLGNLRATTAAAFCASRAMPSARYSSVRRANASSMCPDDGDCLRTTLRRLIAPVWSPRLA